MIRFIDLGDQIVEGTREFAWWDTVTDTFLQFSGEQTWETWDQFETDFKFSFPTTEQIVKGDVPTEEKLARFKRLFPEEWP